MVLVKNAIKAMESKMKEESVFDASIDTYTEIFRILLSESREVIIFCKNRKIIHGVIFSEGIV